LDFIAGDVVDRERSKLGSSVFTRFSQHHAEHLITRADELPRFNIHTEIVFPGTVYVTADANRTEFFPCIVVCLDGGLSMGLVPRLTAFRPTCRYPYSLHTMR
jgi:hypothetical protein